MGRERKRIVIVGAGRRVIETALPVVRASSDRYELAGVFARSSRRLDDGTEVRAVEELRGDRLADGDLVYVVVKKDAVPDVLGRLARCGPDRLDLLLETPVLLFKHFRHAAALRRFRHAWAAEDCVALPWLDVAREVVRVGTIGALRRVILYQSAYRYHALAIVKQLFDGHAPRRGRHRRLSPHFEQRDLVYPGDRTAWVLEPRDYPTGRFLLIGERGSLSDDGQATAGNHRIEPIDEAGRCVGFRAAGIERRLDEVESTLMGERPPGGVTARMEGQKRVGFLRLLRRIADGSGAYPTDDALDDMIVDYALEKLGRYRRSPFTSGTSAGGRALFAAISRFAGR